ncbi:hypothetical protein GCM10017567_75320 [Amycolatopsis bullii]|uniref:Uncharacterized protein n=1 Tax=Amycolatopsis bullii TaxID=941987 RepID=A0ABQ3KP12_9PSEU|nr:hypothetical protein GCM10017567_75320 [Amycolatopsis bullii]
MESPGAGERTGPPKRLARTSGGRERRTRSLSQHTAGPNAVNDSFPAFDARNESFTAPGPAKAAPGVPQGWTASKWARKPSP